MDDGENSGAVSTPRSHLTTSHPQLDPLRKAPLQYWLRPLASSVLYKARTYGGHQVLKQLLPNKSYSGDCNSPSRLKGSRQALGWVDTPWRSLLLHPRPLSRPCGRLPATAEEPWDCLCEGKGRQRKRWSRLANMREPSWQQHLILTSRYHSWKSLRYVLALGTVNDPTDCELIYAKVVWTSFSWLWWIWILQKLPERLGLAWTS